MSSEFIRQTSQPNWFEGVTIVDCEFDQEAYSDEHFSQLGVPFSPRHTNSVVKRKAEYLAGRYCAKRALAEIGVVVEQIPTGERREPLWPQGIVGSISHSHQYALSAVATSDKFAGIGIDAENIVSPESAEKLKAQILTPHELDVFARDSNPARYFTLCFSLKESFFKAAYSQVQRYFDFSAMTVMAIDWNAKQCEFRLNEDLSPSLTTGACLVGHFTERNDHLITFVSLA